MIKSYTILFLFLQSFLLYSQKDFVIDTLDYDKREKSIKDFQANNERLFSEISILQNGKTLKILKNNLNEFSVDFISEIKNKNFVYDYRFLKIANTILDELKLKNPGIPKDIQILISKDPTLNAYCLPNGTFVLNIGLFYWLENEDQFAGVLAHEISHKLLQHSIKSQVQKIENDISEKSKQEIKELKQEKFNKNEKALNLFKKKIYDLRNLSKQQELEADSLGYQLLKNTRYNRLSYVETLKLSQKYDTIRPKGLEKTIYKKYFDLPNQKFNDEWLEIENFSEYQYELNKEKLNLDSLSTHPQTQLRIDKLVSLYPELKNNFSVKPSEEFSKLKIITEHNAIPNLFFYKDFGKGIYLCLLKLRENSEFNEYYKKLLGIGFKNLYEARKQYKLNSYVERINPKIHSNSYIQYLSFIWNLKLDEIKNISEYYNK